MNDPQQSIAEPGYGSGNVKEAIEASTGACYSLDYGRNKPNHEL